MGEGVVIRHTTSRTDPATGSVLGLDAHAPGFDHWAQDGTTSPPGYQCGAWTAKGQRCPKEAVVDIAFTGGGLGLCGGHYGMHRRGRLVPLA